MSSGVTVSFRQFMHFVAETCGVENIAKSCSIITFVSANFGATQNSLKIKKKDICNIYN